MLYKLSFLRSRMRTISASIPLFVSQALLSHIIENAVDVPLIFYLWFFFNTYKSFPFYQRFPWRKTTE